MANIANDAFTMISKKSKEKLDNFFNAMYSAQEVNEIIEKFVAAPVDGKGRYEKNIVKILSYNNALTGYVEKYGEGPVCKNKRDEADVMKAAEEYKKFAAKLPAEENIDSLFYKKLAEIFSTYRKSSEFIERTVRRRMNEISPELVKKGDSTRLLILKQFLKAAEFPKKTLMTPKFRDHILKITKLSDKVKPEDATEAIAKLDEGVFDVLDKMASQTSEEEKAYIEKKDAWNEINEKYKEAKKALTDLDKKLSCDMKKAEKELKGAKDENEKALKQLEKAQKKRDTINKELEKAREKELPEEKSLTAGLEDADKKLSECQKAYKTKEAAFKTAKTNFNEAEKAYLSKEYTSATEEFEKLEAMLKVATKAKNTAKDANKEKSDGEKEKYQPMLWATDLANATFGNQKTTTSKLYWFAVIFEMSFSSGKDSYDKETDIQKNLFFDYYVDNMLNNLDVDETSLQKKLEYEPTGHGINFKNFAEVIYLYYICRDDLSPFEKLKGANKMIEKCKTSVKEEYSQQEQMHKGKDTKFYKDTFTETVLSLSEDELYEFITDNYICGRQSTAPVNVASGNVSAARVYENLVNEHLLPLLISFNENAYWYYDNGETDKKNRKNIKRTLLKYLSLVPDIIGKIPETEETKDLAKLLGKINSKFRLTWYKGSIEEIVRATFLPAEKTENYVTRTKMIVLFYYLTILDLINENKPINSLARFTEYFCNENDYSFYSNGKTFDYRGINKCLKLSGYQPMSSKNIFDIVTIFYAFKNHKRLIEITASEGFVDDEFEQTNILGDDEDQPTDDWAEDYDNEEITDDELMDFLFEE